MEQHVPENGSDAVGKGVRGTDNGAKTWENSFAKYCACGVSM